MRINIDRLSRRLDELAGIGQIPGNGVCRLAFSAEDKAGRDYVEARMRTLGLHVSIDVIGNILGIRDGQQDGPLVLTGSHTDTVGTGGRFDGSLGVLAGLEAIERLNEENIETQKPIGVISFVNEEGVRFMPDMMGSLFLVGDLTHEAVLKTVGIDGSTIESNLHEQAYAGSDNLQSLEIDAFVELHIEQGPYLESQKIPIGIVEKVQGISWFEFTFEGTSNHAGTTPMSMRQDAGHAAAALAYRVRQIADEIDGQRATVGSIKFSPNLINVIASEASLTVDLRNPDHAALEQAEAMVREAAEEIASHENVLVHEKRLARVAPTGFDARCIDAAEQAATSLGYAYRRMISGAGHDAQILARKFPATMIFVPSKDGVSHNVNEYTAPEAIEAGANVLLNTLLTLAR